MSRTIRDTTYAILSVAVLLTSRFAVAQLPPASAASPASGITPAVAAAIADAEGKVKAGQFAEAVTRLTQAETPGIAAVDKRELDFAEAGAQTAWTRALFQSYHDDEALTHANVALAIDQRYPDRRLQSGFDFGLMGTICNDQV